MKMGTVARMGLIDFFCSGAPPPNPTLSKFDPELFFHSAYDKFLFVTFATKVLYLTFCDKMR